MGNVANYVNIFFLEFTITFFSLQTLSPQFFLLVFSHRRMEATTAHIRNTTLALPFSPLASVPMSSHPFTWAISDIFLLLFLSWKLVYPCSFSCLVVVVQSLNRVQLFETLRTAACQTSLSSPSPRVCSNSCPWSQWCHPTISFSVSPFSSCLQSCPASGSFPMNWLFASGDQRIEASASASVLPMIFRVNFL